MSPVVVSGRAQIRQWLPSQGSSASQALHKACGLSLGSSQSKQVCVFFNQM